MRIQRTSSSKDILRVVVIVVEDVVDVEDVVEEPVEDVVEELRLRQEASGTGLAETGSSMAVSQAAN
jgi:hypothetical protein